MMTFEQIEAERAKNQALFLLGERSHSQFISVLNELAGAEKDAIRKAELDNMTKAINDFIVDNWGLEEGEKVYRLMCNTFDDDYEGINKLYRYVLSVQ